MSVAGSRKRSSNVGHHLDGALVKYSNGTTGFRQTIAIGDVSDSVSLSSELTLKEIQMSLNDLLEEQRLTNFLLKGILQ